MKQRLVEYLSGDEAAGLLHTEAAKLGATEFARVRNLDYVFAPFELYPLAPRVTPPLERIAAFAVDMDGTSTTTEPLALHALEYMVRRFTGRLDRAAWPGLDPHADYPYVIGNSNFRHTEFLLERYGDALDRAALCQAFGEAVLWTLACMTDEHRRREVVHNARACGLGALLDDDEFRRLVASGQVNAESVGDLVRPLLARYASAFRDEPHVVRVSVALDVYYLRYHSTLRKMEQGAGNALSRELLGDASRHLVEPMPGYAVFVPLVRGWLGAEAAALFEPLREALLADPRKHWSSAQVDAWRPRLARLGTHFARHPAKLALVTASTAYEAHAVMKEILRLVAAEAATWPVSNECKERLAEKLADLHTVFDGFVDASAAHEARLKPHRDLYSIALYQMSLPRADYPYCVGLEDTEPGIVALRAAGVGCAVALPNRDTGGQDYTAAAKIIHGGLPELILAENLLLREAP
ncbi:MAG: hypothetical protein PVJ57_12465 [Phycisphaerae bacterium]|jgi:beta-phosphoglucomutase-like phosphatase (HAD superfamily)